MRSYQEYKRLDGIIDILETLFVGIFWLANGLSASKRRIKVDQLGRGQGREEGKAAWIIGVEGGGVVTREDSDLGSCLMIMITIVAQPALQYVRTEDMTADILTKALPRETFQRHVRGLGMVRIWRDSVLYDVSVILQSRFPPWFYPTGFCMEVFPRNCLYITIESPLNYHPGSSGRYTYV